MTRVNVAFKRFAFVVMIANIIDVLTAIVTSAHDLVPNPIHYLFNIADSVFASLSAFMFIYYVYAYSTMREVSHRLRNIMNGTLLTINLFLLLTNPITGWVFTYTDSGDYIHEFLFVPVAYGFPILFFAIGSLYMFSVPRGYADGFNQWCKQVAAICLTAFLQTTLLFLGLMEFPRNMLLGLGIMLAANEVPRIAQQFGLDSSVKVNMMSVIHATNTAVNLTRGVARVAGR